MISSPPVAVPIRQNGKWGTVGDSLQSGFGGAVPWIVQASASWYPDRVAVVNQGVAGQSVGPAATAGTMTNATQLAAIDAIFNGALNYNIASIWGGANDIQAGRTAADIYTDLTTWFSGRHAVGFKTMCLCVVKMNKPAPFLVTRAALNASILANAAGFDQVLDLDSIPGTPGDGINYDADGIHLTTAGQTVVLGLVLPKWRAMVGL